MSLHPDAILRHSARPVPRYTSYPTAPHFHAGVNAVTARGWLEDLPEHAALSLYVHIPFCDTLCWFCGCHTKITRQYQPIVVYLEALGREIDAVARLIPASARVTHLHWGGGSPTILGADDIRRLVDQLHSRFNLSPDLEFAVEVDPRGLVGEQIHALTECGLSRVSIGVQDFDPTVQAAINRVQSFAETERAIDGFRRRGVRSLNIDAIYGLPRQHRPELERTLDHVIALEPDRIALFGYAHVPWMKRHQSLIKTDDLPGVIERHAQAERAGRQLTDAGYDRIGIDHFARASDSLAVAARAGRVQRNFQGYTVDPATALIGLGASAISKLPQGHLQNEPAIAAYQRMTAAQFGLATVRGISFSNDDRMRGQVIERLMCDLVFEAEPLRAAYGAMAEPLIAIARDIIAGDRDGLVRETRGGFIISDLGRPFARAIAAAFDAYLPQKTVGHSLAV